MPRIEPTERREDGRNSRFIWGGRKGMGRRRGGPPRRRWPVATGNPDSQPVGSSPTVRHLAVVVVVVVNPQRVGVLVHVRGRARVMETRNRGLGDGWLGSARGHDELAGGVSGMGSPRALKLGGSALEWEARRCSCHATRDAETSDMRLTSTLHKRRYVDGKRIGPYYSGAGRGDGRTATFKA